MVPYIWVIIAMLGFLAGPALAKVDCGVATQIGQVHASLSKVRSQSAGWITDENIRYLSRQSVILSPEVVANALAELDDPDVSAALIHFVMRLSELTPHMDQNHKRNLSIILQHPEWRALLDDVALRLNSLPCGEMADRGAGTDNGRPVSSDETNDSTSELPRFEVKNLREKLTYTSVLVVALIAAAIWLAPILRQRKTLKRRRSKRFMVSLESSFQTEGRQLEAEIVNLSCTGAKFRYWDETPIALKNDGLLQVEQDWAAGTVVWANNLYAGVQFATPLPIAQVRRLAKADRYDALGRPIAE